MLFHSLQNGVITSLLKAGRESRACERRYKGRHRERRYHKSRHRESRHRESRHRESRYRERRHRKNRYHKSRHRERAERGIEKWMLGEPNVDVGGDLEADACL